MTRPAVEALELFPCKLNRSQVLKLAHLKSTQDRYITSKKGLRCRDM